MNYIFLFIKWQKKGQKWIKKSKKINRTITICMENNKKHCEELTRSDEIELRFLVSHSS